MSVEGAAEVRRIIRTRRGRSAGIAASADARIAAGRSVSGRCSRRVLGAAAHAIHDRVQAPFAICGQSVLAAAALAGQGHADVVLPIGPGQSRPLSLDLISIAASGERKSACDTEAMWPIRRREAALREQYDCDKFAYTNDRAAYDRARKKAEQAGNGDRAAIRAALDALGPEPVPPLVPMLTCSEPTYEGMCRLLAEGQASIGIFAAEGGQFIGGHGMSDEARLRTATGLSAAGTASRSGGCASAMDSRSCPAGGCRSI